jgi:nucleoid-associated protein YgaU
MRALALPLALVLIAAAGCNQPPKPAATPPLTPEMMAATQPAPAITEPREEPTYRPAPRPVTVGPGPVRQPGGTLPPFAATAGGHTYTIQKGDTLYGIARKLYNDPRRVKDIQAANPDITDPDKLKEGQVIKVPEK